MSNLVILLAFIAGLAFKKVGYPPLPGYLLAGFVAHYFDLGHIEVISAVADVGLTLLLFTIGLKLDLREVAAPQVWGVAAIQIAIAVPLTTLVIVLAGWVFPVMALEEVSSAWVLALALSFSSTVFAVKAFEGRGESASFHAKIAIGILVIQDIIAVVFLVITSGKIPDITAVGLIGLLALRPVLLWTLKVAQHGELVVLFGVTVALGSYALFEVVDLKGGLGALFLGVILSNSPRTKELYNSLISLKDLFLIGFFLQIGYYGLPTGHMWFVAIALSLLIFLRPVIYFLLFVAFRLRARTSMLAGASLFNYSEFGLVVAAFAMSNGTLPPEWVTTIALAVSISFFIATPLNTRIHMLYSRFGPALQKLERAKRIDAEIPANLGSAEVVILGMGRVGRGAFDALSEHFPDNIVGVEERIEKVREHRAAGLNCVHGDATDYDFWAHSGLKDRKLVLVNLTNHAENLVVLQLAMQSGYTGKIAVVSRYPDHQAELEALGCISFNLYGEAGHGFAEHVINRSGLLANA